MRKPIVLAVSLLIGAAANTAGAACPSGMPDAVSAAYTRTIQLELNIHGYDAGQPDGQPSLKTETAIGSYQQDAKLPVDGCISKGLVDHLQFVLPKVERARGSRAKPEVIEVQTLLSRRGYYVGAVDGVAGGQTRAALRRFELGAKIEVSNLIDRTLIDKIKSADPAVRGDKSGR
jgi:peptidoglycan hydrolase-like protein with peptidoglycan-binding domain